MRLGPRVGPCNPAGQTPQPGAIPARTASEPVASTFRRLPKWPGTNPHRSRSPQLRRFEAQDDDLDDELSQDVGPTVRLDFDSGREVTRD